MYKSKFFDNALYANIFKLVLLYCHNQLVTVWFDSLSNAGLQFSGS